MSELKRALGLWQATMFGIGLILGAGIYVVIGRTAAYAGPLIWLSVVVAGLIALFTGLSYAELSGLYPKASSSYFYVKRAFDKQEMLAFLVGWMIFFEAASGAATAAVGFSRYFIEIFQLNIFNRNITLILASAVAILIFTYVNYLGIEESSKLNIAFTLVEVSGLIIVIILGALFGRVNPDYVSMPPKGWIGILQGAALIFFAYVGFELMATTSEETIDARRTMPKAIILALTVCGLLYLLVALSVVKLMDWKELAIAGAPLASAVKSVLGSMGWYLLASIALFSTSNTILGFLVSSSRIAYGMSYDGMLNPKLSLVHPRRKTPHYSVILAGFVALFEVVVSGFYEDPIKVIDVVAKSSNLGCLIAFIFVNFSVLILRRRYPDAERPFKIPLAPLNIPVTSLIGVLLCALTIVLVFHETLVWAITLAILGLGLAIKTRR